MTTTERSKKNKKNKKNKKDVAPPEIVVGVDTHKDNHVAVVLSMLGAVLGTGEFAATAAGYAELLTWARTFGHLVRAGVEGTSSYGAGLTRHLLANNVLVLEVNRPNRQQRRLRGKTDTLDAESAARSVLNGTATAQPKNTAGLTAQMRVFLHSKDSANKARTAAVNQLRAALITGPNELREKLGKLSTTQLIKQSAALQPEQGEQLDGIAYAITQLAHRCQHLDREIKDLKTRITTIVKLLNPVLLDQLGVGPDVAAILLLTAGDNPLRLTSEASFAALCGVSPVQASSGATHRKRLNRGGDRRANKALHTVALTRLAWDQKTKNYIAKKRQEGKSSKEALRCLKRHLARQLFKFLKPQPATPAQTTPKTSPKAA